jgi:quinol monooxygenase YgiN
MEIRRNETQLVCIARFIANEGEADQLLKSLHSLIPLTHQEGGCIRYELNQSIDDVHVITFVEKFYDQKTFDEHCNQKYIVDFFKDGKPDHVKEFDVSLHKEILP